MKKGFTLLFVFCSLHIGMACSCFYISDYFCPSVSETFAPEGSWQTFVVRAEVVSIYNQYMDVKIQDNIVGEISEDVITILGQDGLNCNQWLSVFEEGGAVILSITYSGWEAEKYDLSGCGRYYLKMEGEMINDNIDSTTVSLSYSDFLEYIDRCLPLTGIEEEKAWAAELVVFPNPFVDQLIIRNPNLDKDYEVDLLDARGALVKKGSSRSREELHLKTRELPAGIYFVRIRGEGILTRKVWKGR